MTRLVVILAVALAALRIPAARAQDEARAVAASAERAGVRVEASASPSDATVADTVTLRIELHASGAEGVAWPDALVTGGELGGMTIAQVRDLPSRIDAEGMLVEAREFDLEPFLPGEALLGPLEFIVTRDGAQEALSLEPLAVTVRALLPDAADPQLAGPKDVVDPPAEPSSLVRPWVIGGSVLLAALAGAGVAVLAHRARGATAVSPAQRALAALTLLDDRVRGETSVGKRPSNAEAYTDLSTILRSYLEDRFEYRASARTTEEFLRDASEGSSRLPADAAQRLREVLEVCDEVKFGGAEPGMAAAARAIDETRAFVNDFGDGEGAPA